MIDKNKPRELAVMVGATGSLGKVIANRLVVSGLDLLAVGRSEAALESLTAGSPIASPKVQPPKTLIPWRRF